MSWTLNFEASVRFLEKAAFSSHYSNYTFFLSAKTNKNIESQVLPA